LPHALFEASAVVLIERDRYVGMLRLEAPNQLGNEIVAERAQEADRDAVAFGGCTVPDFREPFLDRGKAALDAAQENRAALRQADGAAAALEQRNAEIGFETGDGAAERRDARRRG
jgi:hypothetical protein